MKCPRHPREETELSCNSCGTPICPKCAVSAPVGMKCPDCARPARTISNISTVLALRCFAVTMAVAMVGGMIVASGFLYFLGILIYGWVVGETAFASSSRRSGPVVETLAGVCAVAGLLGSRALIALAGPVPWAGGLAGALGLTSPFVIVGLIVAGVLAVGRVRYR